MQHFCAAVAVVPSAGEVLGGNAERDVQQQAG